MASLLVRNARLVTPVDPGRPLAGPAQGHVRELAGAALLCRDGRIAAVGPEAEVTRGLRRGDGSPTARLDAEPAELDAEGRCLVPGFVDPHTHLPFVGTREREFLARLAGADYLAILAAGGGILSTVRAVRQATEEELFAATRGRAMACLRLGTTTLEAKSGYGLELQAEMKQLRVIARLARETPLTVAATFLGAHAVPPELAGRTEEYVDLVAREMVPAVGAARLATFCDAFCERGVFSVEQARRVLAAAAAAGMRGKLHADELGDTGGAGLAAELGAVSADHLRAASGAGIAALARSGTVAVLLPATTWSLRKSHAPARRMIEAGLPVAVATDCNPGSSFTTSMPFVFALAVMELGLGVNEALAAATLNAAYAIGLGGEVGSLEPGKLADFLLLDGESPGVLAYRPGDPPVAAVYKRGERIGDS